MSGIGYASWRRWMPAILLLVSTLLVRSGVAQHGPSPRLVAIGDIHGDFDKFAVILQRAKLTDDAGRWIGGNATLIQTGDFTDRGPKVRAVMDLLMELEPQATAAGGKVIVLAGNHEVMNMVGDLRDVTPEIYATFAEAGSEGRREAAYEAYLKFCAARAALFPQSPPRFFQPIGKAQWMDAHPPGAVEYREAFTPQGRYGRWLRTKVPVLQVGDTVFMHAGVNPDRAPRRLDDINRQMTGEIKRFDDYRTRMIDRKLILPYFSLPETLIAAQIEVEIGRMAARSASAPGQDPFEAMTTADPLGLAELLRIEKWSLFDPDGPLWFRGFMTWSPSVGVIHMKNLLQRYNVARFVVGHSVVQTRRITPRFSGAIMLIDTGMVFPGGVASALEIQGDRFDAIYADTRSAVFDAGAR